MVAKANAVIGWSIYFARPVNVSGIDGFKSVTRLTPAMRASAEIPPG